MKDNGLEMIYSEDNAAIKKDDWRCVQCGYSVKACRNVGVLDKYDINPYSDSFDIKADAIERAKEIAENRDAKVISYTKDGKKQD